MRPRSSASTASSTGRSKAFVVRRAGSGLTEEQVREWCAAALASFKVPVAVEFRESLPYTETGKLLKQQLEREEQARTRT